MKLTPLALALPGFLLATSALSDTVETDDLILQRDLCVGSSNCVDGEVFSNTDIKIKSTNPEILLQDTSTSATNNWAIKGDDDTAGALNSFSIGIPSAGEIPFAIAPGADSGSLFIDSAGNIGLGTTIPSRDVHIASFSAPGIVFERTNASTPYSWEIIADNSAMAFRDRIQNTSPLIIQDGASTGDFYLRDTGDIGMGTTNPQAALHVRRTDNTAGILVTDTGASGAQELFKMENNGGSFFTLDNTASGTTWFFVHENAAPNRFIITDAVNDGPEMSLTAEGDLTIQGNFISGATQLNVPDYVFAPDYELRPLAQVASFIKTNRHLPDVPSAAQIGEDGLDMTDMQMTLLKKVEELTLYTLAQEAELKELRALKAEMAQIRAMLAER